MGTEPIEAFLRRHRRIGLDTSVFVYAVEAHAKYIGLVTPIFHWIQAPSGSAVTSTITMTEALVRPYRLSNLPLVKEFHALLVSYPHLHWIAPTLEIADRAAHIRADHNLKTPDAIQAATAILSNVTGFVSNDSIFRRLTGLDVLILDEMLQ